TVPIVILPMSTAVNPDDYTIASSITIPAGAKRASTSLAIVDDTAPEISETIRLGLGSPTNAVFSTRRGDPLLQVITIPANDQSIVSFALQSETVNEKAGSVQIEVKLTNPSTSTVTVPFSLSGTAGSNDYTISPASELVFNPGDPLSQYITVTIQD